MPKMKTSRSAAKRFHKTGTGKLKRNKAYKSHILTKKSTKRKRNLRKPAMTDKTNEKNMKKILDFMAAACLLFDVDWSKDFEDDEYVVACRREKALQSGRIRVVPGTAAPKAG